ncbi:hypothetical protein [Nocardiopsis sp. JB363]|uniref:hypothetical protein n=1 Tax=Nocardiopsis sp. JB363 TaxID=1434837 RepID=UPI00097A45C2|nr:hypothetical protein [Nocardiopsis sp. JB363]SIO85910.1 hypothetical protein BQ8420_09335 [Nocardiopsis sp. JB363]
MPKKPRLPFAVQSRTEDELSALVRRVAAALAPETVAPGPGAALTATPAQARDADLARLRATEALRKVLDEHAYMLALGLAMRREAPVTYADLGEAVGISRQAARTRWPVLPDAKPGRPKDTRHRWERYVDAVETALQTAGVYTTMSWAETNGTDDEREERWEGGVSCGADTLAWNEDRGWWLILNGESVRDLPVAVDAPVKEVAVAALAYLPVLRDRRPEDVLPGDRIRDLDMLWEVIDTPFTRPDGTVTVPVRDTTDPEETTQLALAPDAALKIETEMA